MKKQEIEYTGVDEQRLDKILPELLPTKSRSYWQHQIENGCVRIDDVLITKGKVKVQPNTLITITPLKAKELAIVPQNLPLDIVYQDNDIAVINKNKGMVVHPSNGHEDQTLVNALLYHIKDLSSINGIIRPGIVHRIDKDTSGLLVVAKNDAAHQHLSYQLKDKTLYREYIALVHGVIDTEKFTIDMPIARHPGDRKKMAVVSNGKNAITHVTLKAVLGEYSLIHCLLETGRTHQIRVHLKAIGYPIVGDPIYTARKNPFRLESQFLHSTKLGLIHPSTEANMTFSAPLPLQLQEILEHLQESSDMHERHTTI